MKKRKCRKARLYRQMNGSPTQAVDCGVSTARSLITFGSRTAYHPGVSQTRERMGKKSGWTTPLDVERAVQSYDNEMRRIGYKPLKYKRIGRWSGSFIASGAGQAALRGAVKRSELVHLVVDYGKVNDTPGVPSGSRGFRGRHSWAVGGTNGTRMRKGKLEVRVLDSLWDGRSKGIPNGPRFIPFAKVWKVSNGAWSDRGGTGIVGGSVACTKPAAGPQPPDPEPDPCDEVIEELEQKLEDRDAALAEAQAIIEELQSRRLPRELLDRLLLVTDEIEQAMEPNTEHAGEEPEEGVHVDE